MSFDRPHKRKRSSNSDEPTPTAIAAVNAHLVEGMYRDYYKVLPYN